MGGNDSGRPGKQDAKLDGLMVPEIESDWDADDIGIEGVTMLPGQAAELDAAIEALREQFGDELAQKFLRDKK